MMRLRQKTLSALFLGVLFIAQIGINRRFIVPSQVHLVVPDRPLERTDPTLFRSLTFGHIPSAVDGLFISSLEGAGEGRVPKSTHPRFYYALDLATDLDPLFYEAYIAGANLLAVIRRDGAGARDLLLKGDLFVKTKLSGYGYDFQEKYWSRSWHIPLLLAYVYLFELEDMHRAATAFLEAARLPNSPVYLRRLEAKLLKEGGEYEVGLHLIDFLLLGASDEQVKSELEKKKDNLLIGQYLFQVNTAVKSGKSPPTLDPWGGRLSLNSNGKVVSSTPHTPVFGLDY